MTQTIVVPANSSVFISSDGGVAPTASTNGLISVVDVVLIVDGLLVSNGGFRRVKATNVNVVNGATTTSIGIEYWSVAQSMDLPAGTHTIQVAAGLSPQQASPNTPISAAAATVSGDGNSVMQGQLTVTIVKK